MSIHQVRDTTRQSPLSDAQNPADFTESLAAHQVTDPEPSKWIEVSRTPKDNNGDGLFDVIEVEYKSTDPDSELKKVAWYVDKNSNGIIDPEDAQVTHRVFIPSTYSPQEFPQPPQRDSVPATRPPRQKDDRPVYMTSM